MTRGEVNETTQACVPLPCEERDRVREHCTASIQVGKSLVRAERARPGDRMVTRDEGAEHLAPFRA